MSLTMWFVFYAVDVVFLLWVVRRGGAEVLEGTLASACLISYFALEWSAEGIKLFAWCALVASTIWFIVGLFSPGLRF